MHCYCACRPPASPRCTDGLFQESDLRRCRHNVPSKGFSAGGGATHGTIYSVLRDGFLRYRPVNRGKLGSSKTHNRPRVKFAGESVATGGACSGGRRSAYKLRQRHYTHKTRRKRFDFRRGGFLTLRNHHRLCLYPQRLPKKGTLKEHRKPQP